MLITSSLLEENKDEIERRNFDSPVAHGTEKMHQFEPAYQSALVDFYSSKQVQRKSLINLDDAKEKIGKNSSEVVSTHLEEPKVLRKLTTSQNRLSLRSRCNSKMVLSPLCVSTQYSTMKHQFDNQGI